MEAKANKALSVTTQAVVSVATLAVAGGVLGVLVWSKPTPPTVDPSSQIRRVEVMQAAAVPVRRQWSGYGTAQPTDSADVPAEVTAVVSRIPEGMVAGAAVRKGEPLVELDGADFARQVEVATQQIAEVDALLEQLAVEQDSWTARIDMLSEEAELARREVERVEEAVARDAAKQREADEVRLRWRALQRAERRGLEQVAKLGPRRTQLVAQRDGLIARRRLAERDLERCTIRSPLDGTVQTLDVEVGEAIGPGRRVARVVSLARIEVPLRLPASARPTIAVDDEATLIAHGAITHTWKAGVARIAPEDDPSTRTMTVYVDLEQDPLSPGVLAPGRFVEGIVVSSRVELRTVVPRRSLLGDRLLVVERRVEEQLVRSRLVDVAFHVRGEFPQLGVSAEQWAVLAEPLPAGALVVINASRTLTDGLHVETVPADGLRVSADGEKGGALRGDLGP